MRSLSSLLLLAACTSDAPSPGSVDILTDAHGIPHIYAATVADAYWGHGYAVASQRMFQMELLRRRAWGTRAEVLGEEYLDSDVQSRALRFGPWGAATATALETEDPTIYGQMVAYVDGVNAFLDAVERGEETLSPHWDATGIEPTPWTMADTLAIEKLLTAGLGMRPSQDLTLGLLRTLIGPDLFSDLYGIEPFDRTYIVPDFYAGEGAAEPSTAPRSPSAPPPQIEDTEALGTLFRWARAQAMQLGGSNNQAVAGSLTQDGEALLASDSHQGVRHPATYWMVHLDTTSAGGDLDIAGATFPGVPFVLFGATQHVAFGPTTSLYDVSDAWRETWASEGVSVEHESGSVDVEVHEHTIRVREDGGSPEDAREETLTSYVVPHHGPILPTESLGLPIPLLVSIGWTGYSATSGARAFHELSTATDVTSGVAALQGYLAGGMHWALADTSGRVAYTSPTRLPVRDQIDPEQPPFVLLPGGGTHDWTRDADGAIQTVPLARIPQVIDPADGLVITANNDPVGATDDGDPFNEPVFLSGVWDIGTRAYRPRKMLEEASAAGSITLDDLVAVQRDTTSRLSQRMLPFLLDAAARRPDLVDADATAALAVLEAWDHQCLAPEAAPTIFHAWLIHAVQGVLADENGLLTELLFDDMDYQLGLVTSKFLIRWLEATADIIDELDAGTASFPSASGRNLFDDRGTPDVVETRDEILLGALEVALDDLTRLFPDVSPNAIPWGDWHVLRLEDPASAWLPEADSGTFPKDGCLYTVDVGDFDWLENGQLPAELAVTNAPSNRFVWSLGAEGVTGQVVLPGGQSEDPTSPLHNSMLGTYLDRDYVPMVRDREALDDAEERTLSRE